MYEFANNITFAEINSTVAENSIPNGSIIMSREI